MPTGNNRWRTNTNQGPGPEQALQGGRAASRIERGGSNRTTVSASFPTSTPEKPSRSGLPPFRFDPNRFRIQGVFERSLNFNEGTGARMRCHRVLCASRPSHARACAPGAAKGTLGTPRSGGPASAQNESVGTTLSADVERGFPRRKDHARRQRPRPAGVSGPPAAPGRHTGVR